MLRISLIHFFLLYFWFPYITSISLSPCAKWNQTGVIIVGTFNQSGNGMNQLTRPAGIFFHEKSNTLYIADSGNNRIQMISFDDSPPTISTFASNVPYPMNVYVNDEGDDTVLYIASIGEQAIIRWVKGESSGVVLNAQCNYCFGISVDNEKNIYTSGLIDLINLNGYVNKWSSQTNMNTIFATNLSAPTGIYLDQSSGSLYVSETMRSRVLMWTTDNSESYTVAASTSGGTGALDTMMPFGVRVDDNTKFVYVADRLKNTIRRWAESNIDIIIGSDQLEDPIDLDFDNDGNLYVSQPLENNIKIFELIDNEACPTTTITAATAETTTTTEPFVIDIGNYGVSLHSNRYFKAILVASILFILKYINI